MKTKRLFSNFSDKIKRFREVMKKRRLSIFVGILLTWFLLIIRISLAENLIYVSDDIFILACEMVTESGPKFKEAAECHEKTLEEYKTYLEQRGSENTPQWIVITASRCPGISWLFGEWDKYTSEKGIDKALQILRRVKKETDELKIIQAIWEAGEKLLEFREEMVSFSRTGSIGIGFHKSTAVPEKLQDAIQSAIFDSKTKCDLFVDGESWEKAWVLCEANRKSVLLLFPTRSRYKGKKKHKDLVNLKKIIANSRRAKEDYAKTLAERDPARKLVTLFAKSDERRLRILEAMENDDIDKFRYLVCQAKEEVIHNKTTILEIASELGLIKNVESSDFTEQ